MATLRKTIPRGAVALALALGMLAPPATHAEALSERSERATEIEALLAELAQDDLVTWESVERRIIRLWSQSGSATADLLLQRGEEAIENEDYLTAVEHLTALTDHAPDFAEGWHARATAFYLMDEFGLSLGDLQRALRLNPDHFGALTGVGVIYEELGDYPLALRAMRLAHDLNPHRDNVADAIRRLEFLTGQSTL